MVARSESVILTRARTVLLLQRIVGVRTRTPTRARVLRITMAPPPTCNGSVACTCAIVHFMKRFLFDGDITLPPLAIIKKRFLIKTYKMSLLLASLPKFIMLKFKSKSY